MLKLQRGAARAHTSYLEATRELFFCLALYEPARTQPRTLAATNSGVGARHPPTLRAGVYILRSVVVEVVVGC